MVELSPASDVNCGWSNDIEKRISLCLEHNSLFLSIFGWQFEMSVCLNFFTFIVCLLDAVLVETAFLELHREEETKLLICFVGSFCLHVSFDTNGKRQSCNNLGDIFTSQRR